MLQSITEELNDLPTITGELTELLDLSGYTMTGVKDASISYAVITFSPDPGWTTDQWTGKIISYLSFTGKIYYYRIISNTNNTITVNSPFTSGYQKIYSCPP